MILIKSVEYEEIDGDRITIFTYDGDFSKVSDDHRAMDDCQKEIVESIEFNYNGRISKIGMTKQVYDVLGIPCTAFRDMSDDLYRANRNIISLKESHKIITNEFLNCGLWARVKFLFSWFKKRWPWIGKSLT